MAKIILSDVSKRYVVKKRPVNALSGVSFEVADGAFFVIMGPSGSGKSTVLQLISGIEQATGGRVVVDGRDLTRMSGRELADYRRRGVGIVFQQFYLEPTLTLRQNMELPAMFLGMADGERRERTGELAEMMGLGEHLEHLPSELSGGQIQRAAVARAIYGRPTILIADEPTSNLDRDNLVNVVNLFRRVQEAYGTTVVVATHDQGVAEFATGSIKLSEGRVVAG
jgi:putative ABC transport system ATP-binding protein